MNNPEGRFAIVEFDKAAFVNKQVKIKCLIDSRKTKNQYLGKTQHDTLTQTNRKHF